MHPALWKLLRLSNKASLRRLLRGAKTVRGALLLLFLTVVLALWLGSAVSVTFYMRGEPDAPRYAGGAAPYLPPILMASFLQSVLVTRSAAHLYFSPAEIDFLFAGPFHRRELLLLKLCRKGVGLVVAALSMSLTPFALYLHGWLAAFVGLTLSLAFVSLAGLAATLARLIVAEAAHTRARKVVLIAVTTMAAVALPQAISRTPVLRFADLAAGFRATWPGRVLLAPFEIFSNAMLAERWFPDLIGWAGAAAAIDLALVMLVLRLDADYLEWSDATSRWSYEQMNRARRAGGFAATPSRGILRFRISKPPWMGGVGPIAWRQLVLTTRKSRAIVRLTLTCTIVILFWNWYSSGRSSLPTVTPAIALGLISYVTYFLCAGFPVAFLGDLDHLDSLKTLPVHPLAVAVGELAGSVGVLAAVQLAILAIYGAAAATGGWLLLAAAFLAPAVDWLLLATNNLLFLLYPIRTTSGVSFDLHSVGRGCLGLCLQMLVLLPLLGIPAGLAVAAYLVSDFSRPVMVATALAALLVELVPMTMLVARAFERFDPSTETPA
jgi:hypothetical protein